MGYCEDVDLMVLEPGIFVEPALASMRLLLGVSGVVSGTTLTISGASFVAAGVCGGMVAALTTADNATTVTVEVVAVTDATTATVSVVRARDADAAVGPVVGGAVKVTVVSFRAQIAAVGDELRRLLGGGTDRASGAAVPAMVELTDFRMAAAFGTLALIYRMLSSVTSPKATVLSKMTVYTQAYGALRRSLKAKVDLDHDGVAETVVRAGVRKLERE